MPGRERARAAWSGERTGLVQGERLLLAGLRAWDLSRMHGRAAQESVRAALARATTPQVAAMFTALMEAVDRYGSGRSSSTSPPPCGRPDDQGLVLACGLAVAAPHLARRLLAASSCQPEILVALAGALNHALAAEGLPLPVRGLDGPAADPSATIH
jgi:hypothetical protein